MTDLALLVLIVPTASRMATIPMARTPHSQRQLCPDGRPLLGGPVPACRRVRLAGRLVGTLWAHGVHARRRPWLGGDRPVTSPPSGSPAGGGAAGTGNVLSMTDSEPGGAAPGPPGPPARPPGPVPDGYVPREWLQQAPPPWLPTAPPPRPPRCRPDDPTFSLPPPPPSVLPAGDVPFLDTPWVPPQTKRQGWMWLALRRRRLPGRPDRRPDLRLHRRRHRREDGGADDGHRLGRRSRPSGTS